MLTPCNGYTDLLSPLNGYLTVGGGCVYVCVYVCVCVCVSFSNPQKLCLVHYSHSISVWGMSDSFFGLQGTISTSYCHSDPPKIQPDLPWLPNQRRKSRHLTTSFRASSTVLPYLLGVNSVPKIHMLKPLPLFFTPQNMTEFGEEAFKEVI